MIITQKSIHATVIEGDRFLGQDVEFKLDSCLEFKGGGRSELVCQAYRDGDILQVRTLNNLYKFMVKH